MLDIENLLKSLEIALNQELPRVDEVRKKLKSLPMHEIQPTGEKPPVIATVATDGGENRLILEPMRMQIIRVMDSRGKKYFEGFIPLSLGIEKIFEFFAKSNDQLQRLKNELKIEWSDIFKHEEYQKAAFMRMFLELLEWSAVLDLMNEETAPHIVVRDGLLRSIVIPIPVFDSLKNALEQASKEHGHLLVGVAKRSQVLSYLSYAISLDESLPKGKRAYITVSQDLEVEAAPANYRWAAPRSMGNLILARLTENANAIYPIEIPSWQPKKTDYVIQALSNDADGSFPNPGYPFSLVLAHRLARIGGFEIQLMEKMLIDELRERNPNMADHVLRQMMLGKKLSIPIGDEELGNV